MDIKSWIEKQRFRRRRCLPEWHDNLTKPEGEYQYYDMSQVSIGTLDWIDGYEKLYDEQTDPMFMSGAPWASEGDYNADWLVQGISGLSLVMPKETNGQTAMLSSNFSIKYGTIRALIKLPDVAGAYSAFWLFGKQGAPECDILEACGHEWNKVHVTHHWGYDYEDIWGKKSTLHNDRYNRRFKPTEKYYMYEIELSPYKVVYRINGVIVKIMKEGIPSDKQRIIFSLTKGSYCDSSHDEPLDSVARMKIRFLEVFKKA